MKLNHIAIATSEPEKMKKLFILLGLSEGGVEVVESEKVETHFLRIQNCDPQIELLKPTETDSAVGKFIDKKGPGIHHLSFEVNTGELDTLSKKLLASGYNLIYAQPKIGAHNMRVNFIHPGSTGGVLIEISEANSKKS